MMTGEQWMAERLKEFAALAAAGPAMTPEKASALFDLLGGDRLLLDQVIATKAARPMDIFDSVSQWLTSGGDPRCL